MNGNTPPPLSWTSFLVWFFGTAFGLAAALAIFIVAMDPYGLRAATRMAGRPIMDLNQRFMYPQIARSQRYDSALFGTSTMRLINPEQLDTALGSRFANLAMNAATPWEQIQIANVFLREAPKPRAVIFGIDTTWCAPDADRNRLTFREFPKRFYDDADWNDWLDAFNLKTVEIAWRSVLNRLGRMPERIRSDGYEVFTPPENTYDLERAQRHIWNGRPQKITSTTPPVVLTESERLSVNFPALEWLKASLARLPSATIRVLVFPPIHVASQAPPGSREAALDSECKQRITRIGEEAGARVLDFRIPSAITTQDTNYWDPLHYRLKIAEQVTDTLGALLRDKLEEGSDMPYRRLDRTLSGAAP